VPIQSKIRLLVTLSIVVAGGVYVFTATRNFVPKYATGGTLVDSSISETGGHVFVNGNISSAGSVQSLTTFQSASGSDLRLNANGPNRGVLLQVNGATLMTIQGSTGKVIATGPIEASTTFQSSAGNDLTLNANGPNRDVFLKVQGATLMTARGSTGNVGIGTATPSAKLHVAGNLAVDGNVSAKYQDVAEWVRASVPALPGSIVVADPHRADHVRPSVIAYDTAVVGVVSQRPGVLLGEPGEQKIIVAQSGRIRVRVDARFGAIKPGDLLVTSPVPGHAMASKPVELGALAVHRPGTILGKALEPLNSGLGEVLVLLTLQ
jgi:hypothetical protein